MKLKKDKACKWKELLASCLMASQSPSSSPEPTFPHIYTLRMMSCGIGHLLGHLGSAVLTVAPPNSLCIPSPLASGVEWWTVKALALSMSCSVTKTSLFPAQIQNTAPKWLLWIKLILTQPKPVHIFITLGNNYRKTVK